MPKFLLEYAIREACDGNADVYECDDWSALKDAILELAGVDSEPPVGADESKPWKRAVDIFKSEAEEAARRAFDHRFDTSIQMMWREGYVLRVMVPNELDE